VTSNRKYAGKGVSVPISIFNDHVTPKIRSMGMSFSNYVLRLIELDMQFELLQPAKINPMLFKAAAKAASKGLITNPPCKRIKKIQTPQQEAA